ncbi:MAG: SEC-C domain-containing protein [Verrucomicrobiae bacterium]|nr:SEC-C domain-containing protein [Verrucomicrobiae bacterium]NNJ42896.1 hypothetical protein [Akkermansiaceae bacterium]
MLPIHSASPRGSTKREQTISRNALCPCGRGRNHKRCGLNLIIA